MSQSMIKAFIEGQYRALNAKDNKERIRYIVAGTKDGRFYDHAGNDYGYFGDVPDEVFIAESDLDLSRITTSKLDAVTKSMNDFFAKYMGVEAVESVETLEDENEEEEDAEEKTMAKNLEVEVETVESEEVELSQEEIAEKAKKAIKKGKLKKAKKLIAQIEDKKVAKKLKAKLEEAESDEE